MYLNCKTYYSFRYGTFATEELVNKALELGVNSLALTNINSTCDLWQFVKLCQEGGIKPITGVEIRNKDKLLYILIAANNDGLTWIHEFLSTHLINKKEFPEHNIIEVLPVENISKLMFKAPAFYSKDIREIGSLIANTDVFIGADSGITHLASAAQAPTVALFSVTDKTLYEPYNDNSVAVDTNVTNTDECIQIIRSIIDRRFIHHAKVKPVSERS